MVPGRQNLFEITAFDEAWCWALYPAAVQLKDWVGIVGKGYRPISSFTSLLQASKPKCEGASVTS